MNTMSYQMVKEKRIESKHGLKNLFLDDYDYRVTSKTEQQLTDTEKSEELSSILYLEDKGGVTILTQSKLLTRLPKLLSQMKARKKSCRLKNNIKQTLYLLY